MSQATVRNSCEVCKNWSLTLARESGDGPQRFNSMPPRHRERRHADARVREEDLPRRVLPVSGGGAALRSPERWRRPADAAEGGDHGGGESRTARAYRDAARGEK